MATTVSASTPTSERIIAKTKIATTSWRYDLGMIVFAVWFFVGLFLDGAAHNRGAVDSFFTPWHLVLYSGFAACAVWVWLGIFQNLRKGYSLRKAIPAGYELSLVGVVIFAVGGILDFAWHSIFGIEKDFEALVSPSHLILALGLFLIMSGPFRAAWHRSDPKNNRLLALLPMVLSLTFTFSILTFFTMSLNPLANDVAGNSYLQSHLNLSRNTMSESAFAMFLLQGGIMVGCLIAAIRRFQLPFGTVTIYLMINTVALSFIADKYQYLPIALLTGLIADGLILWLKPSLHNVWQLRLVAFVVPSLYYLTYFVILSATQGVWWSVPLWTGAIVMCGAVGVLLSYLLVPSPVAAEPAR